MLGAGPDLAKVTPPRPRGGTPGRLLGLVPLAILGLALSACGGTPLSGADSGVGCSVTVLIPSSAGTLLGQVQVTVQGHTYDFRRNVDTVQVGCGVGARLRASASSPAKHPFTEWILPGRRSDAATVVVTVNGPVSARPTFLVPVAVTTPSPSPSPSSSPSTSPTPSTVTVDRWLSYDAATKTVTWKLVAGYQGADLGLNFDGESTGAMKVSVPQGWTVTVDFSNGGSINHSAAIVTSTGTTPVFPGAETPTPTTGTAPGQTASFTFVATTVGSYRISCLLPGHEAAGMWDSFTVATGGLPTIHL